MQAIIWALTIVSALAIIGLVLIQHGKGADVGAAFGSGSAGSLFGSSGAANFLSRSTAVLAVVFFLGCLLLTYLAASGTRGRGVLDRLPAAPASSSVPATSSSVPATSVPATSSVPAPAANTAPAPSAEGGTTPAAKPADATQPKAPEVPK